MPEHETFRGLCDAYAICERAVRRCEASRSRKLRAEYEALQRRLETGLLERRQGPGEESRARL